MPSPRLAALRVASYRRLWTAQLLSSIGTGAQLTALTWVGLHHGSPSTAGALLGLRLVAGVLLGTWAGIVVDRVGPKPVLARVELALAGLALGVAAAVVALPNSLVLPALFAAAVMLGVLGALEGPAVSRLLAGCVAEDLAGNASALNGLLLDVSKVAAPAVAAVLLSGPGVCVAFVVNAGTCLALRWAAARTAQLERHASGVVPQGARGLVHVLRTTTAVPVALAVTSVCGMFGLQAALLPVLLAQGRFGGAPWALGVLGTAFGAGSVAGSIWTAGQAHAPGLGRIGAGSLVVAAGWSLLLLPTGVVAAAAAGASLAGVGAGMVYTTTNAAVTVWVPPAARGRVFGLYLTCMQALGALGALVLGLLAGRWGTHVVLDVTTLTCAAAGVAGLGIARRRGVSAAHRGGRDGLDLQTVQA